MLSLEKLKALGADVDDGLERCLGDEDFYLSITEMALADDSPYKLAEALESGDLDKGFELAHSLKGIYANVSLTPLFQSADELTELLRVRKNMDYAPLIDVFLEKYKGFYALLS